MLQGKGVAPNCITCHGSLNARTYNTSVILETCTSCHNKKTKNHPEIVQHADRILSRLNMADGYRKWAALYYTSERQSGAVDKVNQLYKAIADSWHLFSFKNLDENSKQAAAELKNLFVELKKKKKK
ncbi:MAG: hypothetical protein HY537_09820 [Deltaproteobacteria bacterium]|nr:hypothetical protein [Deltaproteobacteria bacterium]